MMLSLEDLVSATHQYHKFKELFDFNTADKILTTKESEAKYNGNGIARLFKCLLLQFMEDLSDRELEHFLQDSTAAKWFCEFGLLDNTPDHSVFLWLAANSSDNH